MRKGKTARAAIAVLAALLVIASVLPAAAMEAAWTPSAAYRASTYYKNLQMLTVTGDSAFDTLSAALSQLGYHEGSGSADLGGGSTGSGNYTEYNRAFGSIGGSYGYAWCAAFVSWCLVQSGAKESASGLYASCTLWVDALRDDGKYRTRSSGYTPRAGDLIFFRSSGTSRASDHVGLVRYVKGGRVYTVEGNSSDKVSLRSYALGDTYIVGYGTPDYDGASVGADRLAAEDRATGLYVVTYDFLNVRAAPRADSTKRGTLAHGAMVEVVRIRDGFGEIVYAGQTAYVSLEYADFVTPVRHTLRYVSEGAELLSLTYYSTDAPRVSSLAPEKEGHRFLYWQDGAGNIYRAADSFSTSVRELTAVFEVIPTAPPVQGDTGQNAPPAGEDGAAPPIGEGETPPVTGDLPSASGTLSHNAAARHAGVVTALIAPLILVPFVRRREE